MYSLYIKPEVDKIFIKLIKKNKSQLNLIDKKISEILNNPLHQYKWLRKPLQNFNRVHIDKHFIFIFKINHENKTLTIYYYAHHDNVYDWKEIKKLN